jgi:hypothetical protein
MPSRSVAHGLGACPRAVNEGFYCWLLLHVFPMAVWYLIKEGNNPSRWLRRRRWLKTTSSRHVDRQRTCRAVTEHPGLDDTATGYSDRCLIQSDPRDLAR